MTSDRDLLKFFQTRGYNIEDTSIIYAKDNSHSLCYGYLNFPTKQEADRCLAEMDGCMIDDKIVKLSDQKEEELNTRVKATNLPLDFDQRRVRALFKHYGNLKSCKLEKTLDGTSRGIGLIQFENRANAETAIYNLDGKKLGKHKIRVKIHDFLRKDKAMETFAHNANVNHEKKMALTKYSSAFTFSAPPQAYSAQRSAFASPYLTSKFEKSSSNAWISNKKIKQVYQPWKTKAQEQKQTPKPAPSQDKPNSTTSKYEKELSSMAQEIHKIRVLLAEQLSHSHGFNNLTEAKRILNKKIQSYQKIYKLRLVELDEHEKNEIEGLPNTFTPEDVQAKEQAIQEI